MNERMNGNRFWNSLSTRFNRSTFAENQTTLSHQQMVNLNEMEQSIRGNMEMTKEATTNGSNG